MIIFGLFCLVVGSVLGLTKYTFYVSSDGSGDCSSVSEKCDINTALEAVDEIEDPEAHLNIIVDGGMYSSCSVHVDNVRVNARVLNITGEGQWAMLDDETLATLPLFSVQSDSLLISFTSIGVDNLRRPLFTFEHENPKGYSLMFDWVTVSNAHSPLFDDRMILFYIDDLFFENSLFEGNEEEIITINSNENDLNVRFISSFFFENEKRILKIAGNRSVNIEFTDCVFEDNSCGMKYDRMIEYQGLSGFESQFPDTVKENMYAEIISISNCRFAGNRCGCSLYGSGYSILVDNSSWISNDNAYGISTNSSHSFSIVDSTFAENSGGAIFSTSSSIYCESSVFRQNSVVLSVGFGAVYILNDTSFFSKNCTFTQNNAYFGGSVAFLNPNSVFFDSQSRIISSVAGTDQYQGVGHGGGIFIDGRITNFDFRGVISENLASISGGGVYINRPEWIESFNFSCVSGNTALNGNDVMSFPVGFQSVSDSVYIHCCSVQTFGLVYHYSCRFRLQFVDYFGQVVYTPTFRPFQVFVENSTSFARKRSNPTYNTFETFYFNFSVTEQVDERLLYFNILFAPTDGSFNSSTRVLFDNVCLEYELLSNWWMLFVVISVEAAVFGLGLFFVFLILCCFACKNLLKNSKWNVFSGSQRKDYFSIQNEEEFDEEGEILMELTKNTFFVGKRNGKGKIVLRKSNFLGFKKNDFVVFEGGFKDYKPNGFGEQFYSQNPEVVKFKGFFVDGEREGKGIEYYANGGKKFQGIFKCGKRVGRGVVYDELTGKEKYKGEWVNDEFVKPIVEHFPLKIVDLGKVIEENKKSMKLIGNGTYSRVFEIEIGGKMMAMKLIREELLNDENRKIEIMKKIEYSSNLFSSLDHPGILKIHSVCLSGSVMGYLCDLCVGPVSNLINVPKNSMSYNKRMSILFQTCDALRYLHKKSLMHRDLKWENILVDKFDVIKVADFDFGKVDETDFRGSALNQTFVGSPLTCSPEVIEGKNYSKSTDVYSFGVMIHQLLFDDIDCFGIFETKNKRCNTCGKYYTMQTILNHIAQCNLRPVVPKDHKYEGWIIKMMKKCWSKSPRDRFSFREVYDLIQVRYKALVDQ